MAIEEEFSIEIPDKEADQIHSGMSEMTLGFWTVLTNSQWTKPSHTSAPNLMLTNSRNQSIGKSNWSSRDERGMTR